MTHPPTTISDAALGVVNKENTAMVTPPLSPILPSTSHLESQCNDPFQPTVWHDLTSIVHRPQRWQIISSTLSTKTVKIPQRFCHPTTMATSSCVSLPKALALAKPQLPKGWVYMAEEVRAEVKVKLVDTRRPANPQQAQSCRPARLLWLVAIVSNMDDDGVCPECRQ
jgi:hypothetical protein